MAGLRVHFVMSRELVERIDGALVEGESRGEFVRRAVEQALAGGGGAVASTPAVRRMVDGAGDPGSIPGHPRPPAEQPEDEAAEFARLERRASMSAEEQMEDLQARVDRPFPVPSEMRGPRSQYVEGVRSSLVAKRDVRPVPKAGEK